MRKLFLLGILLFFCIPVIAEDKSPGQLINELLIAEEHGDPFSSAYLAGLISGVSDVTFNDFLAIITPFSVFGNLNASAEMIKLLHINCAPINLTHGQKVQIFRNYIKNNPEELENSIGTLIRKSLEQKFPCSKILEHH